MLLSFQVSNSTCSRPVHLRSAHASSHSNRGVHAGGAGVFSPVSMSSMKIGQSCCNQVNATASASASLDQELMVAESAARAAADVIMAARPQVLTEEVKFKDGGEGPVTRADMEADEIIRSCLEAAFPDDCIITEESFCERTTKFPQQGRVWMVDPLDGTRFFTDPESNDFCVMIGLCVDCIPCLGVIMDPTTGCLWKGVYTGSVQQAWVSRQGGQETQLEQFSGRLGSTLRFTTAPPVNPRFPRIMSEMVMPCQSVPVGSAGLKAMMIVEGKADMYASSFKKISVWDICAAHAILLALGGDLLTLKLKPVDYSQRHLTQGLFAHQPGVDEGLRIKVQLMYEYIEEWIANQKAGKKRQKL